jgi:hypothetical protein
MGKGEYFAGLKIRGKAIKAVHILNDKNMNRQEMRTINSM